jgi:hypothetical protein
LVDSSSLDTAIVGSQLFCSVLQQQQQDDFLASVAFAFRGEALAVTRFVKPSAFAADILSVNHVGGVMSWAFAHANFSESEKQQHDFQH